MKKYRLDQTDTIEFDGQTLYRVVALLDFGDVKAGDRGGYIGGEKNLDHEGDCWVADRAKVRDLAQICDNAKIRGNAGIWGNVQIRDHAWIWGNVQIWGNAKIRGNARVSGNVSICGNVKVRDNARIWGNAQIWGHTGIMGESNIRGDTELYTGTWKKSPIQIQGSRHWLHQSSPTHVCIGCKEMHIDDWLEKYSTIGRGYRYSEAEIEEYGEYLRLCKRLMTSEN